MHITDVDLLDGNATLHQLHDILRILADDEDQLLCTCLVDGVDRLLDGPIAHSCISRRSHIHQALTQAVASHLVIRHQNQVCADCAAPLRSNLSMNQTIVDSS